MRVHSHSVYDTNVLMMRIVLIESIFSFILYSSVQNTKFVKAIMINDYLLSPAVHSLYFEERYVRNIVDSVVVLRNSIWNDKIWNEPAISEFRKLNLLTKIEPCYAVSPFECYTLRLVQHKVIEMWHFIIILINLPIYAVLKLNSVSV